LGIPSMATSTPCRMLINDDDHGAKLTDVRFIWRTGHVHCMA
jgi:hypothetical protein